MMQPKNKVEPVSESDKDKSQDVPGSSLAVNTEITTQTESRSTTSMAFPQFEMLSERNTLVWKDTNGEMFTTLSSESHNQVECSDVLDGFNFDRPELIIRILGNAEHSTTSYDYREIPELEYCVSYTGKGGVHLLPMALRRRFIELVHEIGAWFVSEYEGKDILESTNQPYVMPDKLKPKFSPEFSIWPPTLGYSSVYLANASRTHDPKERKPKNSSDPYECVLVASGDVHSLEQLLRIIDLSTANILIVKGSGGLADALAHAITGETSNFSLEMILSALGIMWSPHKTDPDRYIIEDNSEISDYDSDDEIETASNIQQDNKQHLNSLIPENIYAVKNDSTLSRGIGAPIATSPRDVAGDFKVTDSKITELFISAQKFKQLSERITIFEADLTLADYGLGRAILHSILRGQPERNVKLMKLCLDLDCFSEAETYLIPKGYQTIDLRPVVQKAFMKKRINFLEYFLRTGVFDTLQKDELVMNSIVTDSRALKFIDKTLWQEQKVNHKDFFGICDHLFRQCLMSTSFDMIDISMLFWLKTKDPLGTLLLANIYLTKVAKKEKNHLKRAQIKATAIEYQSLAVSFVNACYDKDPETTIKMITHKMDQFDGKSCIDLAMESSNLDFIVQPPCVTVQRRVWRWGNLYDFYTEKVQRNLLENSSVNNRATNILQEFRKYYLLLCVPKTMFTLNGLGLVIFIYMFGLTLLGRLEQYNFHWLEAVLLSNVVVGLCEEIYEFLLFGKDKKRKYFGSGWNIADVVSILLFFAGAGCRVVSFFMTGNFVFELSRVILAIDFIVFTLRLLHNCYSSPELGPTCAMILKTIKLLLRYLYLLLLAWASYAIASESILYPNSVLSFYTFYYLFRKAYWQMFGELFLDELEAGKDSDPNALECTNNASLYATYQMLRCPSPVGRYIAPVLLAVYIMFTFVLLFSLITASFTKSIEKIQQKANKLWRFQFFELTRSFSKIMFLPLPFTLVSVVAQFFDEEKKDEDGFSISDTRNKNVLEDIKEIEMRLLSKFPSNESNSSTQAPPPYLVCCLPKDEEIPANIWQTDISRIFKVIKKCVKKPNKENSFENRSSALSDLKEIVYCYKTFQIKQTLQKELKGIVNDIENILTNDPGHKTHLANVIELITSFQNTISDDLCREVLNVKFAALEINSLERKFEVDKERIKKLKGKIREIERLHCIHQMKKCIHEITKYNTINIKEKKIPSNVLQTRNTMDSRENKKQIYFNKLVACPKELLDHFEKLNGLHSEDSKTDLNKQEKTMMRELKRRIFDLQKALEKTYHSNKPYLNGKYTLDISIREKIRGLLTALNYYWQISFNTDIMESLDDLEKILLQNHNNKEYFQIRAKIKDLETLILQSHIEPMLQKKQKGSELESANETKKATPTLLTQDVISNEKKVPIIQSSMRRNNQPNSMEELEDTQYAFWVPIHSDQAYVSQSKEGKEPKEEPCDPKSLRFNCYDTKYRVERRSYLGRYDVDNQNYPINPYYDPGGQREKHKLSIELPRWGPNHFGIPIISRVKLDANKVVTKDNQPVLEFLVEIIKTDLGKSMWKYKFPKVNISASSDVFLHYIKMKEREAIELKKNQISNQTPKEDLPNRTKLLFRLPLMMRKGFKTSSDLERKKKKTQLHMKSYDNTHMRSCQKTKTIFIGLDESENMMTENTWAELRIINYHNPNTYYQEKINSIIQEKLLHWVDYKEYNKVQNFTGKDIFTIVCGHRGCYFEKAPGIAGASARPRTGRGRSAQGKYEQRVAVQEKNEQLTAPQATS